MLKQFLSDKGHVIAETQEGVRAIRAVGDIVLTRPPFQSINSQHKYYHNYTSPGNDLPFAGILVDAIQVGDMVYLSYGTRLDGELHQLMQELAEGEEHAELVEDLGSRITSSTWRF